MARTINEPASAQYARAVLELANESRQAIEIGQDLAQIRDLIDANPAFGSLLRDPAISAHERRQVIERIFSNQVSPLLMNTLHVMNEKGRLGLLAAVATEYAALLDRQLGKINVDVTVAAALDDRMLEEVKRRVGEAFQKDATIRQHVDERIIGGMVLQVDDRLIDGSVRSQLEAMKKQMLSAAPKM